MATSNNAFQSIVTYILISILLPISLYVGTSLMFSRPLSILNHIAENFFIRSVVHRIKKEVTQLQSIPNRDSEDQAKLEQEEHDLILHQEMQKNIIKEYLTLLCLGIIILLLSYRISSAVLSQSLFTGGISTIVIGLLLFHVHFVLGPIELFLGHAEIIFALATFIVQGHKLGKELK